MSLTDVSNEKFEEMFVKPLGGTYESGPDKLIGFGTANYFKSLVDNMGILIGHDSAADFSDRSNDWQMLALLKPTETNFNKELRTLSIEATSFLDVNAPEEVNVFSIGDRSIVDVASL